jgi:plastocyanin
MNARTAARLGSGAPLLGALLAIGGLHNNDASGAASNAHAKAAAHVVTIEGMQFKPAALTVRRGERITWVNKDLFPHTATGPQGTFDSTSIPAGASWSFVAVEAGTVTYTCAFHPTMKATLTVR